MSIVPVASYGPRRYATQLCGVLVLCCSALVLLGWAYDIPLLRTFVPGAHPFPPMVPNTALGLGAMSVALLLVSATRLRQTYWLVVGLLACVPLLIGLLTLAAYLGTGANSIDQLLFAEATAREQTRLPGRPAPTAALGLVLLGVALFLIALEHSRGMWVAQFLAAVNGLDALRVLIGYLYQASGAYQAAFSPGTALPTALCLLLTSVGILALRPHLGLVGVLLSNSLAGTILRRLVPSIIIIVLAIELAHHLLNWERLFGSGFTSVVLIAATALVSVSIVYALERVDATRRENEARYRTLVDLSPHGIFVQQHERVVFHNSALSQLLHAPHSNALVGLSIWSLIHHDDHALVREQLNQMRQPGDHVPAVEQRWLRRDGELVSVEVTASAIRDVGQPAVLVVVHDISERKRLQAQLGHAQRMESIGRLAGGVAHDFNNLLSVIMGCTSLAAESLPTSHPVQGDLREIQAVSDRAKTLVRQLLLFARRQPTLPQQLDLNSMVRDIDRLLRHLLPKTIRLTYQLAPDLNNVLADASQLEQVLVNLVVNARDAMPQGGSLIVETANVMFDAASVGHYLGSRFGPHVMLAVSDTGVGMSAEVQQRAFEPFFSTKPPGEGTGLGLATCYGVVKQHGGTIWIYSEVGHGTTIKVYLPSVTGEVRDAVPSSDAVDVALQSLGHETVLLVEDAEEVRRVVARTLELYGYVVLQAADGNEALRLAALAERPASLLLTDVVMSDVNGYALAEALTGRWPGLRVLFMSGYTDAAAVQQGQAARGAAYLEKPFSPTALVRKVREVLDVY